MNRTFTRNYHTGDPVVENVLNTRMLVRGFEYFSLAFYHQPIIFTLGVLVIIFCTNIFITRRILSGFMAPFLVAVNLSAIEKGAYSFFLQEHT